MNTCEFCGKELAPIQVNIMGNMQTVGYAECSCFASKRAREQKEREKKNNDLLAKYRRIGIPERYIQEQADLKKYRSHLEAAYKRGLYLFGPVGTGKTYTAAQIAKLAAREGKRGVKFTSEVRLLETVKDTYGTRQSTDSAIGDYIAPELLIVDDVGKGNYTNDTLSILYRVFDERWNAGRNSIVTSNYARPDLVKRMAQRSGDDQTPLSIVSRLMSCHSIELKGDDRRIKILKITLDESL